MYARRFPSVDQRAYRSQLCWSVSNSFRVCSPDASITPISLPPGSPSEDVNRIELPSGESDSAFTPSEIFLGSPPRTDTTQVEKRTHSRHTSSDGAVCRMILVLSGNHEMTHQSTRTFIELGCRTVRVSLVAKAIM